MEHSNSPSEQNSQPREGQGKIAAVLGFLAHPIDTIDSIFQGGTGGEITAPGGDDGPHGCVHYLPKQEQEPEIKPPK